MNGFSLMVDSSAFNDIREFLKMAAVNAAIDEEAQDKVINRLCWIFGKSAKGL